MEFGSTYARKTKDKEILMSENFTPLCRPYSGSNTLEGGDQLKIDH
jgi:hypothetical protein